MNKKKYILGVSILLLAFLSWYLFFKKSDYTISFKVKAATGTVFQGIKEWSKVQAVTKNENYKILTIKNFNFIQQELKKGNQVYKYEWQMNAINDSVCEVVVDINQENASIYNRLTAPFFKTEFKEEQIAKIKDFRNGLNEHLKNFKIKIDGEAISEETFVAYINLKSILQEKAQTMIMNDSKITGFLHENNIEITGKPYLEVLNWNVETEKLDFNYCFPIDKNTKIIPNSIVKFKTIPAQKGLKATYYGNYRTSDRAWFSLLDYAKKNNLKIGNKPLEHFFANPFNGGNELNWKTIIIIPFS